MIHAHTTTTDLPFTTRHDTTRHTHTLFFFARYLDWKDDKGRGTRRNLSERREGGRGGVHRVVQRWGAQGGSGTVDRRRETSVMARDGNVIAACIAWLKAHMPPLVKRDESLALLLVLGGVYLMVFVMALTQLLRTHYRLNKSITKQKLFFIFTAFCALIRSAFFISLAFLPAPLFLTYSLDATITEIILSNLPGYLFFSTYCLLIVYWAEIVDRVRNPTYTLNALLRPTFVACNTAIYVAETVIWTLWGVWSADGETAKIKTLAKVEMVFFTTVSLCAALSFLYFGGRLVVLLRRVDIVSGTRGVYSEVLRRRLREVAFLSIICTTSFLVRAGMVIYWTLQLQLICSRTPLKGGDGTIAYSNIGIGKLFIGDGGGDDDNSGCVRQEPYIFAYYIISEVIPSLLLLYILRELPKYVCLCTFGPVHHPHLSFTRTHTSSYANPHS